jgi:ribosomal protein L36
MGNVYPPVRMTMPAAVPSMQLDPAKARHRDCHVISRNQTSRLYVSGCEHIAKLISSTNHQEE